MAEKFIVKHKNADVKEDKSVVLTIRVDKTIQDSFDDLAFISGRSRNELLGMALKYALDNLQFLEDDSQNNSK